MADRLPNILMLMTDHQRVDSVGMVQCGVEVTPRLNRLAQQGTFFRRAYNACPLCIPARTALATGKYPTANGVVNNDREGRTAGDCTPIHQYLAEAGYEVGHVGVRHVRVQPPVEQRVKFSMWVGPEDYSAYQAELGFADDDSDNYGYLKLPKGYLDTFKTDTVVPVDGKSVTEGRSNAKTGVWPYRAEQFFDLYMCRQAVDFIGGSQGDRPFALFVYLWAPHPPLILPQPYASMFDPAKLELAANVGVVSESEPPGRRGSIAAQLAQDVTMDQWRQAWAAHLGLVRLADDGFGQVLDALDATGQADNTLVLFTSDHGDHLGQHRMYQKFEMYEQAICMPLVVKGPGVVRQESDAAVSHLDIVPTLLDIVGIAAPGDLDGISLRHCLETAAPPPADRHVFCQYSGIDRANYIRRAVISGRYKYVYDPADEPELYDLEADPLEMENLASSGEHAATVARLREACRVWAESHGDWVKMGRVAGRH